MTELIEFLYNFISYRKDFNECCHLSEIPPCAFDPGSSLITASWMDFFLFWLLSSFHASRWIGQTASPFQFLSNLASKFLIKPWIEVSPKSKLISTSIHYLKMWDFYKLTRLKAIFPRIKICGSQQPLDIHLSVRLNFPVFGSFTRDVRWK